MARTPTAQSGHLSTGSRASTAETRPSGPVPKHHQLALGKTNGMDNVQGVGRASTEDKIGNGKKGCW